MKKVSKKNGFPQLKLPFFFITILVVVSVISAYGIFNTNQLTDPVLMVKSKKLQGKVLKKMEKDSSTSSSSTVENEEDPQVSDKFLFSDEADLISGNYERLYAGIASEGNVPNESSVREPSSMGAQRADESKESRTLDGSQNNYAVQETALQADSTGLEQRAVDRPNPSQNSDHNSLVDAHNSQVEDSVIQQRLTGQLDSDFEKPQKSTEQIEKASFEVGSSDILGQSDSSETITISVYENLSLEESSPKTTGASEIVQQSSQIELPEDCSIIADENAREMISESYNQEIDLTGVPVMEHSSETVAITEMKNDLEE